MASFSAYYRLLVATKAATATTSLTPAAKSALPRHRPQPEPQWSGCPTIDAVKRHFNLPAHVPQNK
jgi:hypothetical protein